MTLIAITQRVVLVNAYNERRDALDRQWHHFFEACGFVPLIIPNHEPSARRLVQNCEPKGIVLSGGNNLISYGGDAPERDATELFLLQWARERECPLMGICRGMQLIQHRFGAILKTCQNHVTPKQTIEGPSGPLQVNSYHTFGTTAVTPELDVLARANDGVIKAVAHKNENLAGAMWHPEREQPFHSRDITLFRQFFGEGAPAGTFKL
jgi:N5-(cytidine 5'-diphosphoramidyl)-L-glutamine hydrolase